MCHLAGSWQVYSPQRLCMHMTGSVTKPGGHITSVVRMILTADGLCPKPSFWADLRHNTVIYATYVFADALTHPTNVLLVLDSPSRRQRIPPRGNGRGFAGVLKGKLRGGLVRVAGGF